MEPPRAGEHVHGPAGVHPDAVSADGTVGVTYYDFRRLAAGELRTLPTDYWLRASHDGGRTFGADQHIAGPFNIKAAPRAGGFFLGD